MRLRFYYEIDENKLPIDYRSGFISLTKEALKNEDELLYHRYYDSKIQKPFTFSLFFNNGCRPNSNELILGSNELNLLVSSNSHDFITKLYNGLLKVNEFRLFDRKITKAINRNPFLLQRKEIKQDEMIIKTLCTALLRDKDTAKDYLIPNDKNFNAMFAYYTLLNHYELTGDKTKYPVKIEETITFKRDVVKHFGLTFTGFRGVFKIKGHPKILQFIYDVGIGVRRSQGFGMVEVMK